MGSIRGVERLVKSSIVMTRPVRGGIELDVGATARSVCSWFLGFVRWRDGPVALVLGALGLVWLAGDPGGLPVVWGLVLVVAVTGPLLALGRAPGAALAVSLPANLLYGVAGYVASPAGYAPYLLLASLAMRRSKKAVAGLAASLAAVGAIALERHRGVNASAVAANVAVVIVFFAGGREIGLWKHRHRLALDRLDAEVRLAEATTRAESLQERLQVSGALHDELGQALAAIGVQSRLARHLLEAQRPGASEALGVVERRAGAALGQLQHIATRLAEHDNTSDGNALGSEGQDLSRGDVRLESAFRLAETAGITMHRVEQGTRHDLPTLFDDTINHVVAEAVVNVVRHSNARSVTVTHVWDHETVTVLVADDGTTGTVAVVPGYGLGRLAAQVAAIGGTLEVSTRPGEGVSVSARFNLRLDRNN